MQFQVLKTHHALFIKVNKRTTWTSRCCMHDCLFWLYNMPITRTGKQMITCFCTFLSEKSSFLKSRQPCQPLKPPTLLRLWTASKRANKQVWKISMRNSEPLIGQMVKKGNCEKRHGNENNNQFEVLNVKVYDLHSLFILLCRLEKASSDLCLAN